MQPHTSTQILIVGAGLTGLTLACDLLRRDIDFRIIDKSPEYFPGSRGKGLTPRSLEVLDDLGVIHDLLPFGYFHPVIRHYDGPTILEDEDVHKGIFPTPDTPYASPLWIPQFQIERVLRDKLAEKNKYVELATELTAIDQDEEKVAATILKDNHHEQITCRYLVAADGGHSFARRYLQVGFEGETRNTMRALVGDVHADSLDHEHTHMWTKHPDGFVALTPFAKIDIFQFQAQVDPDFEAAPTLDLFQKILDERTGMNIKLSDPTWLSSFKVNIRMVDHSIVGRVFIAGDAAHVHPPTGGQGMNTGIQDAYNLGWKLGAVLNGTNPKLLETYEEERLPVAAGVLKLSTNLLEKLQATRRFAPADNSRFQLTLNYRESSLSKQATDRPLPLQAGDRAPDAPLNNTTLFDIFRGPHFTLLYTGDLAVENLTAYPNLKSFHIDSNEHFAKTYGDQPNTLYLIRPDGYIGFIGETLEDLTSYLDKLFAS